MTDYLKPKFSVTVGSDDYRAGWDRTFSRDHDFADRCGRNDPDCRCGICVGGLAYCEVCHAGESELADRCPGPPRVSVVK